VETLVHPSAPQAALTSIGPAVPKARSASGKVTLENLTPHEIDILLPTGRCTLPGCPDAPRLEHDDVASGTLDIDGIEIPLFEMGNLRSSPLPDPREGTYYLVSAVVATANRSRRDLLVVHDYVRDSRGAVVGCRSLARYEALQ
jgi:hypothetical protein